MTTRHQPGASAFSEHLQIVELRRPVDDVRLDNSGCLATLPGMAYAGTADSDKYQHVIAATSDGNLHEIYWSGGAGVSRMFWPPCRG